MIGIVECFKSLDSNVVFNDFKIFIYRIIFMYIYYDIKY